MATTPLLVAGLPGKMALEVALLVDSDDTFSLLAQSLSSPSRDGEPLAVGRGQVTLVGSDRRDTLALPAGAMAIDYSTPDAAVANAQWYAEHGVPFVMGTTGFDTDSVQQIVTESKISAVVAPNMAAPIVLLQAAMRWLAEEFPGGCTGSTLTVFESHQQGKRDTSGTAKALVASFQQLGIDYEVDQIERIRDPQRQLDEVGVPEKHLTGHAFHRYDLSSAGGTVALALEHNVVGRRVYAEGTLAAARFLKTRVVGGSTGQVFTMEEVLRG